MPDFIIVTTIFEPTSSIKKLSQNKNAHIIVAGDKKTPPNWNVENSNAKISFLAHDKKLGFKIERNLPYNHYCRKMLGYIFAKNEGANVIYETDDDNYPKENWSFPNFNAPFYSTEPDLGFINVYKYFTKENIWPRGFPLDLILENREIIKSLKPSELKIGVVQGLVDNEPDVDAIYRLTSNRPLKFEDKSPIALERGTICPYNSQNTFTVKALFPLLYLPCTVTFRFTDILRGLIAQPLMWNEGYKLLFTTSTAVQNRNVHNYMKDFESEIPVYLYAKRVVEIAESAISKVSLSDNIYNVYKALINEGIVKESELPILENWLLDIN